MFFLLQAMFQFWKIKLWDWEGVKNQMISWYDGFSTFYVGGDGLVYKHVADSVSGGKIFIRSHMLENITYFPISPPFSSGFFSEVNSTKVICCQQMMPDQEKQVVENGILAAKMAALFGLVQRPAVFDGSILPSMSTSDSLPSSTDNNTQELLDSQDLEDVQTYAQLMLPLERIQ